jgi:transposase InsO family protein/transposase-like protein
MQQFNIFKGTHGFERTWYYGLRLRDMITQKAKHKARVLKFWQEHGILAAKEAFGIGRSTLFLWQKQLREGKGKLESLNEQSKRPKETRKRQWPNAVVLQIRQLREDHPNIGKDKIYPLLQAFCEKNALSCPQSSTIGRIIADAPDKMRVFPIKVRHNGTVVLKKRPKKARKPKDFKATYPGHCGSFDTIERFIHGCRRYVITFTDLHSRFSFAWSTTSHASKAAEEFFDSVQQVFPYPLQFALTDNGSEFMKHFDLRLRQLYITHWHTYPKTPKMNAHNERFNRTIQEEFIDYHDHLLLKPERFNKKLMEYLLWYNTERPHYAFANKLSPIQYLMSQESNPQKSNMWWTHTTPVQSTFDGDTFQLFLRR